MLARGIVPQLGNVTVSAHPQARVLSVRMVRLLDPMLAQSGPTEGARVRALLGMQKHLRRFVMWRACEVTVRAALACYVCSPSAHDTD